MKLAFMKYKLNCQQAIDAMCKECIYDPISIGIFKQTLNQQIEDCTSPECPLYEYRPLTGKTKEENKQKYIASLSEEAKQEYFKQSEKSRIAFNKNVRGVNS